MLPEHAPFSLWDSKGGDSLGWYLFDNGNDLVGLAQIPSIRTEHDGKVYEAEQGRVGGRGGSDELLIHPPPFRAAKDLSWDGNLAQAFTFRPATWAGRNALATFFIEATVHPLYPSPTVSLSLAHRSSHS